MAAALGLGSDQGSELETQMTREIEGIPAPESGVAVTLFLVVGDVARSGRFYSDVLGGTVTRESGPTVVRLSNAWIIMNPGGGPTPDKPDTELAVPDISAPVSAFMNLRVADIDTVYRQWTQRGARFLTPPLPNGDERRCYIVDPDGHLIEVGQHVECNRLNHED